MGTTGTTDSNKRNIYGVVSNAQPTASLITNLNLVQDRASMAPTYNSTQKAHTAFTKYTTTDAIVAAAQTFYANNLIYDTDRIANFASGYTIDNSPVRNYLGTTIPLKMSQVYDGTVYELEDLFYWYNDATKPYIKSLTYNGTDDIADVGTYSFTVELENNADEIYLSIEGTDALKADITVEITPKPISMTTLKVDEFGALLNLPDNTTISDYLMSAYLTNPLDIASRDLTNGRAPSFELQYKTASGSWTSTVPTTAGTYYVRASLTNSATCNYTLESDGETTFTRAKDYVALPYLFNDSLDEATNVVGSTTTVYYNGTNQIFDLRNSSTGLNGVKIDSVGSGLQYSLSTGQFSAGAVDTYTLKVSLSDGGVNTQWADRSGSDPKTVTLVIKPAELVVTIDDENKTSWSKGDRDFEIKVFVDGIINNEGVKLDVAYGLEGSSSFSYLPIASLAS